MKELNPSFIAFSITILTAPLTHYSRTEKNSSGPISVGMVLFIFLWTGGKVFGYTFHKVYPPFRGATPGFSL